MKTLSLYWFDADPLTVQVLKADGTRRTRKLTQAQEERLKWFFLRLRRTYGQSGLCAEETLTGRMIYRKGLSDAWLR
jgi:hypothetical protein